MLQPNGRWKTVGVRDGVFIEVVLDGNGSIVTGYPKSGPGVQQNPKRNVIMNEVEFMNRTDTLFQGMRERIPQETYSFMSSAAHAGEHYEVLDVLLAMLKQNRFPISWSERDELRTIMESVPLPIDMCDFINDWQNIVASLNIVDEEPARDGHETLVTSGPTIIVHENPDFGRTLRTQVGLHVDLPPRLYEPFVDHFTSAVGVGVQINLTRTNPDEYLRGGKVHKPTTVEANFVPSLIQGISSGSIWGGGILLRGFEQWWTKARSGAESLVRQIPAILAAERHGGDNFHIALAELSTSTVDQVIAILAESEVLDAFPEPVPPIPVFKYPSM
ncbi:hypothetical protein [Saccharopolyspora spinosa]|uniref:hypothetical protein n=1 Tax=Saccharopolyspora spinosa TaxID=60894 RepID=UPI00117A649C|nr:hypothetical protein [Saccharopolyspora spinosa]